MSGNVDMKLLAHYKFKILEIITKKVFRIYGNLRRNESEQQTKQSKSFTNVLKSKNYYFIVINWH